MWARSRFFSFCFLFFVFKRDDIKAFYIPVGGGEKSVAKERVDGYKSKVLEKERAHWDSIGEDSLKQEHGHFWMLLPL